MSSPREAELTRALQAREEELQRANARIALLQQKINLLIKRIFGSKSEKLDPKQLELLLELQKEAQELGKTGASSLADEEKEADPQCLKDASKVNRRTRNEPRWPLDLRVVEEVLDPDPVKACPEAWRLMRRLIFC